MRTQKGILKAIGLFSGVHASNMLCSIVRAKCIALWIGPAGVGLLSILNSAIEMVANATQLGLRDASVREISTSTQQTRAIATMSVRRLAKILGLVGALVMALGSPLLSWASFGDFGHWWLFAILAAGVFALSVTAGEQGLMQGSGELKTLARRLAIGVATGTALSLPLFYFFGLRGIPYSVVLMALSVCFFSMRKRWRDLGNLSAGEDRNCRKRILKLGLALAFGSMVAMLANYAFLSYLNQVCGTAYAGCYQAGYMLAVRYVEVIFTAMAMEYYPRLAKIADRPGLASVAVSNQISTLLCLLVPLALVFIAVDQFLLRLFYSQDFMAALPLLTIGIGSCLFRAISYSQSYVIIARADSKVFAAVEVASAIIGLTLSILLQCVWGMEGLGLSLLLWHFAYMLIVGSVCRIRYGLRLRKGVLLVGALSVLIVGIAVCLKTLGWGWPLVMLIPGSFLSILVASKRKKN